VGDGAAFFFSESELVKGTAGKPRGELLEGLHAAGGRGEAARDEKRVGVAHAAICGDDGVEERVPVVDSRLAHHAAKKISRRAVGEHGFSECNKSTVHVVRGHCCGDAVDASRRQDCASGGELRSVLFYRQLIV
jgi:hypothetical protein